MRLDGTDYTVGEHHEVHLRRHEPPVREEGSAREILSATLSQSYYTDERGRAVRPQNQSAIRRAVEPTHFAPVRAEVRGSPTDRLQADFRTDWDPTAHTLRTLAANGSVSSGSWLRDQRGLEPARYIPGFNSPSSATQLSQRERDRAPRRAGGSATTTPSTTI